MSPTTCLLTSNLRAARLPLHLLPPSAKPPSLARCPAPARSWLCRGLVGVLLFGAVAILVAAMIVCPFGCIRPASRN